MSASDTGVLAGRSAPLIWEDEEPGSAHWWLSRARVGARNFFIAEDELVRCLVVMVREAETASYNVIAAPSLREFPDPGAAMTQAKAQAWEWLDFPDAHSGRRDVRKWRAQRSFKITAQQLPMAAGAFFVGAILGLAVALFSITSQLVGWPMLVTGLVIGAGAGALLKSLADRRAENNLGAWARLTVVTVSALAGAAVTAGGVLALFWN